jgi:AbiV family abortive infection protein
VLTRDQYNRIFDNGVRHLDAAELLSKSGMFGFAVSHIVLGIEELIKYHIVSTHINTEGEEQLFADESNPANRDSVFRSHLAKHDLIREFHLAISEEFSETFVTGLFKDMMGHELDNREREVMNNRFRSTCAFLGVAYRELSLS